MCVSSSKRYFFQIESQSTEDSNHLHAGNYYSFANAHEKDARLFFTQGCVPTENEIMTAGSSPTRTDAPEQEEVAVRAKGVEKGRARGKQKKAAKE